MVFEWLILNVDLGIGRKCRIFIVSSRVKQTNTNKYGDYTCSTSPTQGHWRAN